jgi:hypothetical protein
MASERAKRAAGIIRIETKRPWTNDEDAIVARIAEVIDDAFESLAPASAPTAWAVVGTHKSDGTMAVWKVETDRASMDAECANLNNYPEAAYYVAKGPYRVVGLYAAPPASGDEREACVMALLCHLGRTEHHARDGFCGHARCGAIWECVKALRARAGRS